MSKDKLISLGVKFLPFVILVLAVWFLWVSNEKLIKENASLTEDYNCARDALMREVERSGRIESIVTQMQSNEEDRTKEIDEYRKKLQKLSQQSEKYKQLLNTIVYDDLLTGLPAFTQHKSK